ncbi:uncharacterized protein [Euwallacea fornicatus]|uniref:uncharacterized protein n=1 Tax=Euwallacea fornicatus TaxID=995702 RepID=UPI00338E2429
MPRTRSKSGSSSATVRSLYRDDSTDEEDVCFGMLPTRPSKRGRPTISKRSKATKKNKSVSSAGSQNSQCDTLATVKKPASKKKNSQNTAPLVIDSDEEVVNVDLTESQVNAINNKIDTFFKALESDNDDDNEELCSKKLLNNKEVTAQPNKSKEFYMVLTDSEEEQKFPESSFTPNSFNRLPLVVDKESTASPIVEQKSVELQETMCTSIDSIKKKKLFAYIDDILNDVTKTKLEDKKPKLTLDDLKKKKDEILGDVGAQVKELQPKLKEQEAEVNSTPVNVAPVCPICLEQLGGSTQAMVTLCGHMFCKPCIVQIAQKSKKCPSCRKGLTKLKYHPVYI